MKSKNNKIINILSNFAITFMLVGMIFLTFSYNTKFTFSEKHNGAYYRGNEENKNVSIMINVYWGSEYILDILDVLDKYNVKTTFFVGGSWVEKNSDLLLEINARGHEIGNHGYFHKDHNKLDYNGNYNEIEPNNLIIEKYLGIKPILFAPPSGAYNKITVEVANALNMKTIMWSKDTIDWRDKNTDLIIRRATNNIQNGDLILAHPTKNTLEALPSILKIYRDSGFNVVPVSKNIE